MFGWIADRYGRIPSMVACNVLAGLAGIATAFSYSFWSFTLCRFIVGFAFDNCFTIMYILGNKKNILHADARLPIDKLLQYWNMLDRNGVHS